MKRILVAIAWGLLYSMTVDVALMILHIRYYVTCWCVWVAAVAFIGQLMDSDVLLDQSDSLAPALFWAITCFILGFPGPVIIQEVHEWLVALWWGLGGMCVCVLLPYGTSWVRHKVL